MASPLVNVVGSIPEPGELKEVAPGIHWLRMPLPFKLDHINLWILEDGDGITLVDTGINRDEVRDAWNILFDGPLKDKAVKRVIVTHCHPDHMGLAGWLTRRFDVEMWTTPGEWSFGRMLSLDSGETSLPAWRTFYHAAGFDDSLMQEVDKRKNPYPRRVSTIPNQFRSIRDGDEITVGDHTWRAITGFGHSPEHMCLYSADAGVMISGDQILPKISPNVSVWPQEPEADPLTLYLDSLSKFKDLPADTFVLPSHNWPFLGLQERLDELLHHHDERLDETVAACATPLTGVEVLKHLFKRELDSHQLFFAIGESLAHLHHLMHVGRIVRERGEDGVDRFRANQI